MRRVVFVAYISRKNYRRRVRSETVDYPRYLIEITRRLSREDQEFIEYLYRERIPVRVTIEPVVDKNGAEHGGQARENAV